MKKLILLFMVFAAFVIVSNAQTLPNQIKTYLDKNYTNENSSGGKLEWQKSVSECGKKQWLISDDFNGDSKKDYVVKITTEYAIDAPRNIIVAFVSKGTKFSPKVLLDEKIQLEDGSEPKVGFWLVPKGGKVPACNDVAGFTAKRPVVAIISAGDCKKDSGSAQYFTYFKISGGEGWGVNC